MELKIETPVYIMWKKEAFHKDNDKCKDGSIIVRSEYPRDPAPNYEVSEEFDLKKIEELMLQRSVEIAKSRANDIIIPDPAPKLVSDAFYDKYPQFEAILKKDSPRCFLQLFKNNLGKGMSWNLTITAQTLTYIVSYNALRCAKVVLEGKAPELNGKHANPNCINSYGYFPIHEAAERFSVDMIKLLLRHGASTNVRTVGNDVIEDLLPLHVAVENTCLHKYLEDNLSPSQNHLDYIYKLILLLCLPEMKIFLDTVRLLAEKTNNLLEELWSYMKDGKLIQSAVLLLAAQEQIRGRCSSKINGSIKKDGFDIINNRILRFSYALRWDKGSNGMAQKLLEDRRTRMDCTGLLVDIISHAGEPLSAYIQAHSEVPHGKVLEHVSSILKEYGFRPTGEVIDTINLLPYDCKMSDKESYKTELIGETREVTETANLHAADEKIDLFGHNFEVKAVTMMVFSMSNHIVLAKKRRVKMRQAMRKKLPGGWDLTYTARSFFPYWRSVLRTQCPLKVYPTYAVADARRLVGTAAGSVLDPGPLRISWSNSMANGSTPMPNQNLGLSRRIPQLTSNHQSRKLLGTAATSAFKLLKVLKNA